MSTTQEPEPAPLPTRVRTYTQDEVDDLDLYALSTDILDTLPFDWQVDTSENILLGNDVILDVGTGNGKSLTFTLSLLPDETDMNLVVCPLTALMIDQATNAKISTVAVCSETLEAVGRDAMFADIVAGKYRLILVSPEIAISKVFSQKVLSQANFTRRLRSVCIDEAHCISLWGGSFRPDYAGLGILRGRLPSHIPFLIASATLPSHILDDVCSKLQLSKDAHRVSLTNDRRNVLLSVHQMKHSEDSKADLRYLIPDGAVYPSEVPQTIIYCNQRLTCEDAADRAREWAEDEGMIGVPKEWIVFYHAKLGAERKREIEEMIRDGRARLVFCTDALGMGCDFRSVLRVVLWGLPPSFCALAQRAGRAVRDMEMDGEATLFVSQSVYSKGVKEIEVGLSLAEVDADAEAENRGGDIEAVLESQGVDLTEEQEVVSVEEVGVRVSGNADEEEEQADALPATTTARGRKLRMKEGFNRREALYLSRFVAGKECRRKVWNDFFGNGRKIQLKYLETTLFKERDEFVCCDICNPAAFVLPKVNVVEREPQLARGRKRKLSDTLTDLVGSALKEWRDTELFELFYGEGSRTSSAFGGLPSRMLLGDDVIERIAGGGRRVLTGEDLAKVTRWSLAHSMDGSLSKYGVALLERLARVYREYDDSVEEREAASHSSISEVPPEQFYSRPKPTRRSRVGSPLPVAPASPPPVASASTQPTGSTEGRTLRRSTRIKK